MYSTLRVVLGRHRMWLTPHHGMPCRIMIAHFGSSPTQRPHKPISAHDVEAITEPTPKQYRNQSKKEVVSLSKRIADLGICSRDNAKRLLDMAEHYKKLNNVQLMKRQLKQVIYLRKEPVYHTRINVSPDETDIEIHPGMPIRLSKRMSELGICSKNDAAAILKESGKCVDEHSLKDLEQVIYLNGKPVMGGAAVKIPPLEKYIEIRSGDDPPDDTEEPKEFVFVPYADRPWEKIQGDTIVINKPVGYVSGQLGHQYVNAASLLTRENIHLDHLDNEERRLFHNEGSAVDFDHWKFARYHKMIKSVPNDSGETLPGGKFRETSEEKIETLSGYDTSGGLDSDSTGVLLFTRSKLMYQRLVAPKPGIQREYIVKVHPAIPTTKDIELGINIPPPTRDLSVLFKRGNRLHNERISLQPLKEAKWLDDVQNGKVQKKLSRTIRFVTETGTNQKRIKRMFREYLGWHIAELVRTSVGPVQVDSVPEGKWRPLTQEEVKAIFEEQL